MRQLPEFVRLADIKAGDELIVGADLDCLDRGVVVKVMVNPGDQKLSVHCNCGYHRLDARMAKDDRCYGFYLRDAVTPMRPTLSLASAR